MVTGIAPPELVEMFTNIAECVAKNAELLLEIYPDGRLPEVIELDEGKQKRKRRGGGEAKKKKRGTTGYLMYTSSIRNELAGALSPVSTMRELASRWQKLTPAERTVWNEKAIEHNKAQAEANAANEVATAVPMSQSEAAEANAPAGKKRKTNDAQGISTSIVPVEQQASAPLAVTTSTQELDSDERKRKKEEKRLKKLRKEQKRSLAEAGSSAMAPPATAPPATADNSEKKKKKKKKKEQEEQRP